MKPAGRLSDFFVFIVVFGENFNNVQDIYLETISCRSAVDQLIKFLFHQTSNLHFCWITPSDPPNGYKANLRHRRLSDVLFIRPTI